MNNLYETDFAAWVGRNVELLRSGRFSEVDVENVAEEIESLGRRDRRELKNRIIEIIEHLLKITLLPDCDSVRGWRVSVVKQRAAIQDLLEESPSLRACLTQEFLVRCYREGREQFEIGNPANAPEQCMFTWVDVLTHEI
ncbi:MAG TPA: DUF29 domain-containing protein [Ktedonobacteraceae bacterium]|nr:DUF29 domain-containing protein [Ktedonobacteraceae bacterium]